MCRVNCVIKNVFSAFCESSMLKAQRNWKCTNRIIYSIEEGEKGSNNVNICL